MATSLRGITRSIPGHMLPTCDIVGERLNHRGMGAACMSREKRHAGRCLDRAVTATLLGAAAIVALTTTTSAQIPAFPGADGAAATITGGRGGTVYHVTKLDASFSDTAAGTLRYGLNNANFPAGGPRTIVFDVGGRINLGRVVAGWDPNGNGWDTQSRIDIPSNVTIAGQTAPSPINIMGGVVKPGGSNIILRNVTIAPGYGTRNWLQPGDTSPRKLYPDSYTYDALDITGNNLMIDHVTTVYGTDETVSMNELASNVTIQYSNISQGQNYPQADAEGTNTVYTGHALGSLLQAGSNAKVSVHHNLYAHLKGRLPRVGSEVGTGAHNDFRNNVFYDWFGTGGGGASGQPSFNKFVNNFWLAGNGGDNVTQTNGPDGMPNTADDVGVITHNNAGGTGIFNGSNSTGTRVYHAGNLKDTTKDGDALDVIALTNADFGSSLFVTDASFAVPYTGVTDTAAAAYDRVLNYVGANWWTRDAVVDTVDERLINEVRAGTGQIKAWADDPYNNDPSEGVEWRAMVNAPLTTRDANWDQEPNNGYGQGDGMPTGWEVAHGLNPSVRDDAGDFDADGYTNLEEYLNEIAAWPAPQPLVFTGATNSRYEQITNWSIPWQPSKYDEARIHTGAVTINSPGQHARILNIAPNPGDNATLTLTAGWIDIAQQFDIADNGRVILDGGELRVPTAHLSGNAQLKLTPGGNKLLKLDTLTIAGNAKLDLADNRLILTGASVAAVEDAIAVAYDYSAWDGPGITTTIPDAAGGLTTLAVASASQILFIGATETALWSGQLVHGDDVLVRYTYGGDVNFDGLVDAADYGVIDNYFQFPGTDGYANGDINFDGIIDAGDYGIIDNAFQLQGEPFPSYAAAATSITAVPEPAAAACLFAMSAFAALTSARRRRRCTI